MRDVQKKINSDLANAAEAELYASLPNGSARNGINANDAVSQNDKVLRIQGMVNKDRTVSAFLLANPFYYDNRLTDPAFRYAFRNRLLISNIGSRQWCVCGSPMDSLGMHPYVCPSQTIRNKAQNTSHAQICKTVRSAAKACTRYISHIEVSDNEPRAKDFLETINDGNNDELHDPNENPYDINRRLDVVIQDHSDPSSTLVLDMTIVCPISKSIQYDQCGDAAKFAQARKTQKYSKIFDLSKTSLGTALFFAIETNGYIAVSSRVNVCKVLAQLSKEDYSIALSRLYQKISVSMHRNRAQQLDETVRRYSLDEKPLFTYSSGIIPRVPLHRFH